MSTATRNGNGVAWQTTKAAGVACGTCGRIGTCTVSPDGTAFKCWKDGGRIHQTAGGRQNGSGTGYIGKAHRPRPVFNGKAHAPKLYPTAEAAVAAAGRGIVGGELAATWTYAGADGAEVMRVARFDLPGAGKEFRPVHRSEGGWKIGDPPGLLPLYRLPELPDTGPLVVCEGEKAADAARSIGLPATTSAHGSSAAAKSDWTPAAGRPLVIFPDADDAGEKYARSVVAVASCLDPPPTSIKVVALPGLPPGGDFVEYLDARDSTEPETILKGVLALIEQTPNGPTRPSFSP